MEVEASTYNSTRMLACTFELSLRKSSDNERGGSVLFSLFVAWQHFAALEASALFLQRASTRKQ